jgi:hypothetical protein
MTTMTAAKKAKTKFNKAFWLPNKAKFNIIGISRNPIEKDDEAKEGYHIDAYLFDMKDAESFPKDIDGVAIKYLPAYTEPEPKSE